MHQGIPKGRDSRRKGPEELRAKLAIIALMICVVALAFVFVERKIPVPDGDGPYSRGPEGAKYVEAKGNLRPGIDLYNPFSKVWIGKVVRIVESHKFPDGTKRPAVEVESRGTKTWMPREGVEGFVVLESELR